MPAPVSAASASPPLTVVLSSCERWPKLKEACRRLLPQAERCGSEVLIAVADPGGLPPGGVAELPGYFAGVRVLVSQGSHIFALRAFALGHARGDVVALLEDHNHVPEEWCDSVLGEYARQPECMAVVGGVMNGSERTRTDRANFLQTFSRYLPALGGYAMRRIPVIAGSSFRRAALPTATPAPGMLELVWFPVWLASGAVRFDPDNAIVHVQSNGWWCTLANHYHNGRACAGLERRLGAGRGPWLGVGVSVLLPLYFLWYWLLGTGRRALALGYRDCIIHLVALSAAHGAGGVVGWLAGPGRSPWKLE